MARPPGAARRTRAEETTPVVVHLAVLIPIGLFVGIVIAVALALWLTLR